MLQAKTYLFCAIRPEVKFHPYTLATLNFASNASVVKLAPKKGVVATNPREKKLLQELTDMKSVINALQTENERLTGLLAEAGVDHGGPGQEITHMVNKIDAMIKEKETELAGHYPEQ